jgi:N,N'-diacetyllegionaminate synthase
VSDIVVGGRPIGPCHPCFVIAEVAQSHDGSVNMAHAFVDAAAAAGANAIKFQTHIAAAESTRAEQWRVRFSHQDDTRYDYWRRMEFSEEQWLGLSRHASDKGLQFLSTPFSERAADLLDRVGVAAWKIASGEVGNLALFEHIARMPRPLLISTGMSPWAEIDAAVAAAERLRLQYSLLQCTSIYPTPAEKVGLNVLSEMRSRYGCPVGLSDHTGRLETAVAAAAIGMDLVEVHVTFHPGMFGPDVPASLTFEQLADMVRMIRFVESARQRPVDKDAMAQELAPMRKLFNKSIVAACDLEGGTVLSRKHLAIKKPGTGMPPQKIEAVIGRRLVRPLKADELIAEDLLS